MAEWIYFIHPLRDDFAATMTDDERVSLLRGRDPGDPRAGLDDETVPD